MGLHSWAVAARLLPVLVLLSLHHVKTQQTQLKERHYYIAAVEIDWNYSGTDARSGPTYKKVVFREYDKDFRQAKTHPPWLGLLGPTLRAEEGEAIVVTFRNMASGVYSLHPHGVAYGKQSEGAHYFDNTSQKEKEDDLVHPGGEHVYYWEVTAEVSPQPSDPPCLTHTYISHQNVVLDFNSGLIGALLVCKPGTLDEARKQMEVHHEYVFLFGVFDEKASHYRPSSLSSDDHVKHTINGYTKGALPGVSMCAHTPVSLHLAAMSSEPEVFSVHMNGQVLRQAGHKVSSVGLISGSTATAGMVAVHAGRWMLSSHTIKHMEAGMHAFVDVTECDGFEAPRRRMTIAQKRQSTEWKYFIAAEEVMWDYAPNMHEHIDEDFKSQYLKQSSTRVGAKYKKAVYTLYTNESFSERQETKQRRNELGVVGPVIRAQIRDVITVVFKNMASKPYSIYPHGLTLAKSQEGFNYPPGGNHSHAVWPGETHTYVWSVAEEDEPLPGDSRCLTRVYHSAVDTPRDIASGLIGTILICKSQSLNVRNVQLKADKEQHAMFAVFDENKSWYLEENIRQYCNRSKVNRADPDFYRSNVMHTINGYSFETGPLLGFCNGEVATWHVSSIGAQDYIQTATFYGHPFELNHRTEDFLSLYPMMGETITMNMENIGVWLLASLNSHQTTKGMRVKFQDVECYRDYAYEYDYEGLMPNKEYTVWNPKSLDEIKKEDKKEEEEEKKKKKEAEHAGTSTGKMDEYTMLFAEELGLRSLKNQTNVTDVEKLDLSFLDYDVVDVLDGETNNSITSRRQKNDTVTLNKHTQNKTLTSVREETNGPNPTEVSLGDQNTTDAQDSGAPFTFDNFYENSTALDSNVTANRSVLLFVPGPDNVTASTSEKPTAHNASVSMNTEISNLTRSEGITTGNSSSSIRSEGTNATLPGGNQTSVNVTSAQTEATGNRTSNISGTSDDTKNSLPPSIGGNIFSDVTGAKQELTNQTVNNSSAPNSTFTVDNQTVSEEDSQERLRRGDIFAYLGQQSDAGGKVSVIRVFHGGTTEDTDTTKTTSTVDDIKDDIVRTKWNTFVLEKTDNKTSDSDTNGGNSSDVGTTHSNSSLENVTGMLLETGSLGNATEGVLISDLLKDQDNGTGLAHKVMDRSSIGSVVQEMDSASESSEEVVIYLQENNTEGIRTTSIKTQDPYWTYEGTHQTVPAEIPEDMKKYFGEAMPKATSPPRKVRKMNLRQRPQKGKGMKTRKRKEYKPQARSGMPFSPRGFNQGLTPRGSRPVGPQPYSDEEKLVNMPVVIGVPRPDFSDYELYVPGGEPEHLVLDEQDVKGNEYEYVMYKDPYSSHEDIKNHNLDEVTKYYLKLSGPNVKTYFIAAEEVNWDYAGYGNKRPENFQQNRRETKFTKVVFRSYLDGNFVTPDIRGEIDEHLGILGPVIKAEVGQSIMVVFKNKASRPYSLHPNGVFYTKQTEGLSYEDGSKYWYQYDNEVQPNTTFTYLWKVGEQVGPNPSESDCRSWAYYSGVNPERDIHSGLIGPLLVCRKGTLEKKVENTREFMLLFMTFDESQSWYYKDNVQLMQRKSRRRTMEPVHKDDLKFHSINGIVYSLKGLRMYTNQRASWHLINMGAPKDVHAVHFHGQTFIHKKTSSYRQAVYPLLPGSFATLEMIPSKPGLWQLDTEVGLNQQKGMQTLFLVLDSDCYRPLGLESGSVQDSKLTAIHTRGYWEPKLARLNNGGKYNAWSTEQNHSWIQVDFQRPVVISQVATQGARQMFQHQFVTRYYVSYSNDRRNWVFYKGDSQDLRKVFTGNQEAYDTKKNTFFPPMIGRFIRLYPISWTNMATIRMEFYGCELDGCSVPLGMESGRIPDHHITASSVASSWYSGPWKASLARLNRQGTINAWRPKNNDVYQWLQVELPQVKKITGIITQGAKSLGNEMYVVSYILQYSGDGLHWRDYTDDPESQSHRLFEGNSNNNDHVKNYIYPPIFSRFVRIVPKRWTDSITMRVELLGCDFE